eukprot:7932656-Pyramimonas_sp.AAC.1
MPPQVAGGTPARRPGGRVEAAGHGEAPSWCSRRERGARARPQGEGTEDAGVPGRPAPGGAARHEHTNI